MNCSRFECVILHGEKGVAVSLGVTFAIPRAAIARFTVLILAGQLVCSSMFDATGSIADTVTPVSPVRMLGFVLGFAGNCIVIAR